MDRRVYACSIVPKIDIHELIFDRQLYRMASDSPTFRCSAWPSHPLHGSLEFNEDILLAQVI